MNITVRHNSSDISHHVISLNTEHKICSGVGVIELEIDSTYPGTFSPWDNIDIYDGGSHIGGYFVSSASNSQPGGTIMISGQDNSKRLSDYFITDSYNITYPSYTRYWIETFLTEIGVSYTFLTEDSGNLLSNNSALGLCTAYEQIMTLLQQSGWYIAFRPSGKAIIGKLTTDMSSNGGSVGNGNLLDIKVIKHDAMLRNRVVVWGRGDPLTERWVFADVSQPTKWDYDENDKRTIVVSNGNIPTIADAFMLANRALLEFARITVEKHFTVAGNLGAEIGDVVSIHSRVYTGKGMITTYGLSLSRNGLVTNVVCDERCPRLFGFFDPGGYVYVSTFGSGVWRHHINNWGYTSSGVLASGITQSGFAPDYIPSGWVDYSSGIMDRCVTDLHVNNGVLASVTSSGQLYYSLEMDVAESGYWNNIPLSGLQVAYSGILIEDTVYSGLVGRACIIDRFTNQLRYAVDNSSGINYGDFLYETDYTGSGITLSGQVSSSSRAWVLDVSPYDGVISGVYPIWIDGVTTASSGVVISGVTNTANFDVSVYDIENDGSNDYVSVSTTGDPDVREDYGIKDGVWGPDNRMKNSLPMIMYSGVQVYVGNLYDVDIPSISVRDNPTTGDVEIAYFNDSVVFPPGAFGRHQFYRSHYNLSKLNDIWVVTETQDTTNGKLSGYPWSSDQHFEGSHIDSDTQTSFYKVGLLSFNVVGYTRYIWNTDPFSFTSEQHVVNIPGDNKGIGASLYKDNIFRTELHATVRNTHNGYLYLMASSGSFETNGPLFNRIYFLVTVNLATGEHTWEQVWSSSNNRDGSPRENPYTNADLGAMRIINGVPKVSISSVGMLEGCLTPHVRPTFGLLFDSDCIHDHDASGEGGLGFGLMTNYRWITGDLYYSGPKQLNDGTFFEEFTYEWTRWTDCVSFDTVTQWGHIYLYNDTVTSFATGELTPVLHPQTTEYYKMVGTDKAFAWDSTAGPNQELVEIDAATGSVIGPIFTRCPGYTIMGVYNQCGDQGQIYFDAFDEYGTNGRVVLEESTNGTFSVKINNIFPYPEIGSQLFNFGRFFTSTIYSELGAGGYITQVVYEACGVGSDSYMILQRDGYNFNVVKSGIYEDRLDISLYSPLVVMGRELSTVEDYYISGDGSTVKVTPSGFLGYNLGIVDDYRYATFDDTLESGSSRSLLVLQSGMLNYTNLDTFNVLSGVDFSVSGIGVSGYPSSGYMTRLETSNYYLPDQYLFVSVSGYNGGWGFFQKNPSSGLMYSGYAMVSGLFTEPGLFFDVSSGYPQVRTTRIRLDDKL